MICDVCGRGCDLAEGQKGYCRARICRDGRIEPENYGRFTSVAIDPIEKKPLHFFHPGTHILSVGSYGCSMRCFFCQNHEISQDDGSLRAWEYISPKKLTDMAIEAAAKTDNIGVAFTYNEPIISYEYIIDTAPLLHEAGLYCIVVTNGMVTGTAARLLAEHVDAFNIDLKSFSADFYRANGGNIETVKSFIALASPESHVEITTLIIPGENDDAAQMSHIADFIASVDPDIPFHITRFYPRYHAMDIPPADTSLTGRLAKVAEGKLNRVIAY